MATKKHFFAHFNKSCSFSIPFFALMFLNSVQYKYFSSFAFVAKCRVKYFQNRKNQLQFEEFYLIYLISKTYFIFHTIVQSKELHHGNGYFQESFKRTNIHFLDVSYLLSNM